MRKLMLLFFLCVLGTVAQTSPKLPLKPKATPPVQLQRFGEPDEIKGVEITGFSTVTKAAPGGVIYQSSANWYYLPFDGSDRLPLKYGKALGGTFADVVSDGRSGFYGLAWPLPPPKSDKIPAFVPIVVRLDKDGKVVAANSIDIPSEDKYRADRIAAFGGGYVLIGGSYWDAELKVDVVDMAVYTEQGQRVRRIENPDEVVTNLALTRFEDGKAVGVTPWDYSMMDETARKQFKPNSSSTAVGAVGAASMDQTEDGNILVVRKGRSVLRPIGFLMKPDGTSKTIHLPPVPGGSAWTCRVVKDKLLILYDRKVDASDPGRGLLQVINIGTEKVVAQYEYETSGVGMLLVYWDGQSTFKFITTAGDPKHPHLAYVTLAP